VNDIKEDIARKILNYLDENPDAGDTLTGISWWLENERIDRSVDEIANVLEGLTKIGKVTRRKVGGRNPIYKICKNHD
jgi:hypothetical protein